MGQAAEKEGGRVWPNAVDGRNPDGTANPEGEGADLDPDSTENDDEGQAAVASPPPPDPAIMKRVNEASESIKQLKDQRSEINSKISAEIEGLEALGINRHAFRFYMRYLDMSDTQRSGLDLSLILCRQAGGIPVQTDWVGESEPDEAA